MTFGAKAQSTSALLTDYITLQTSFAYCVPKFLVFKLEPTVPLLCFLRLKLIIATMQSILSRDILTDDFIL